MIISYWPPISSEGKRGLASRGNRLLSYREINDFQDWFAQEMQMPQPYDHLQHGDTAKEKPSLRRCFFAAGVEASLFTLPLDNGLDEQVWLLRLCNGPFAGIVMQLHWQKRAKRLRFRLFATEEKQAIAIEKERILLEEQLSEQMAMTITIEVYHDSE